MWANSPQGWHVDDHSRNEREGVISPVGRVVHVIVHSMNPELPALYTGWFGAWLGEFPA